MTTTTPTQETVSEADPFTYHLEPLAQGGEEYARCTGCRREILTSIGADKLLHAEDCPHVAPPEVA